MLNKSVSLITAIFMCLSILHSYFTGLVLAQETAPLSVIDDHITTSAFPLTEKPLQPLIFQLVFKPDILKDLNSDPNLLTCREEERSKWIGKASYYSESGCVGCNSEQVMANGERFDENAYTIAFMRLPLNTPVKVTNLDNNKSVRAIVADTGGFEELGRIADLSMAVSVEVELSTDQSRIEISPLNCG